MPEPSFVWILVAAATGVALAFQGPVNGQLGSALASPVAAALISVAVSSVTGLVILSVTRTQVHWGTPAWWLFVSGGLLGIVIVTASLTAVPKLGAAAFLATAVAGQVATGLALDHYGILGLQRHEISPGRMVAGLIIVVGVVLLRIF